jgi:hypothetical protein
MPIHARRHALHERCAVSAGTIDGRFALIASMKFAM